MSIKYLNFGDYLIFVDESGDHGLNCLATEFPIFVLAFVVINKTIYIEKMIPAFQKLKLAYWGHDQIIFHEHDMRKQKGDFAILRTDPILRENFLNDINQLVSEIEFTCFASVVNKTELLKKYNNPFNPYQISLLFCLEKVFSFLIGQGQAAKETHVIIESRGKQEDTALELEFRRICDNQGQWGYKRLDFRKIPFTMKCADKKSNSPGLQLADLIARPIGLKVLRPQQENRAYEIIKSKLKGTKIFPSVAKQGDFPITMSDILPAIEE